MTFLLDLGDQRWNLWWNSIHCDRYAKIRF